MNEQAQANRGDAIIHHLRLAAEAWIEEHPESPSAPTLRIALDESMYLTAIVRKTAQ